MIRINNRRYIGNKSRLLEDIYKNIPSTFIPEETVFADYFAGTGSVADFFAQKRYKVIIIIADINGSWQSCHLTSIMSISQQGFIH